jgi:hypothetical protein
VNWLWAALQAHPFHPPVKLTKVVTHRHRYFGVLAPNSPLRAAVVAFATPVQPTVAQAEPAITGEGVSAAAPLSNAVPIQPSPAHYLWAVLIARIYEVFPLLCPMCGG